MVEAISLALLGNTLASMGERAEGVRMVESALTQARDAGDANTLGWCLYCMDWQRSRLNRKPLARWNECVAAFRRAGNEVGLALALEQWIEQWIHSQDGAPRERVDEFLGLAREQGSPVGVVDGLIFLGFLAEREGDLHKARRFMEASVDVTPVWGAWGGHYELGRVLAQLGEYQRAGAMLGEFLRRLLTVPTLVPAFLPWSLLWLALVAGGQAQHMRAARLYGASHFHVREKLRQQIRGSDKHHHDETVQQVRVALGEANWERLCAEGAGMTLEQVTALALAVAGAERVHSRMEPV